MPLPKPLSLSWRNRLHERFIAFKNELIANPRFQRWAAGFPLTRGIARRRASALFDLCAGFVYSQVLLAAIQLKLFDHLSQGPLPVAELARRMNLAPDAARRLLKAAASLKLVQALAGDRYALDDLGAAMRGNAGIAPFVEHHHLLYDDLRDPVALLRGQTTPSLAGFWPYAANVPKAKTGASDAVPGEAFAPYSELMSASQVLVAEDILEAYPFAQHRCLMDVGGGEGTFLTSVAANVPTLPLILYDLPPVAARAKAKFARLGLSQRAQALGGNFLTGSLPPIADIISLVRIVHDHDDESVRVLLRATYDALPNGGTLLVAEPMSGIAGTEAMADAYFGFYLLAMGRGRARTPDELTNLLAKAGFSGIRQLKTRRPLLTCLMTGQKL